MGQSGSANTTNNTTQYTQSGSGTPTYTGSQADGRVVQVGGLFDFESGDISGSFYVNNAQIYVGPGATDAATVHVVGPSNTLLGNEGPSVTLLVQGDDGFNQGVLTAAAGAVNAGSIVLGSTSGYWGSVLAAPGTLLNASGGQIAVADDNGGGARSLVGDFINAGAIVVPADRQLSIDGADDSGPTLIVSGGSIQANGRIVQHGGLFDFESGQTSGDFAVNNASLYVGPGVTTASTVEVVGPFNTLLDNASATTTLWVRGDDDFNQGVLTAAPGAGNSGTIVLASASAYWGSVLAAPDGFVNRASGQIAVYGGGGAPWITDALTNDGYLTFSAVGQMYLDALINDGVVGVDATGLSLAPGAEALAGTAAGGVTGAPDGSPAVTRLVVNSWTNDGEIGVDPGTQLELAPTVGGVVTQSGGLVVAAGTFLVDGGLFHFTGGGLMGGFVVRDGQLRVESSVAVPSLVGVVGAFHADGSQIYVSPDVTASSLLHVVGPYNTLLGNATAFQLNPVQIIVGPDAAAPARNTQGNAKR